jgi:molybdopterin synthase catalytic subunit
VTVRVQTAPFDLGAEAAALVAGRSDAGALVTFSGLVRDEAGTLEAMEIEHYPGMTEKAIAAIEAEAVGRWGLVASLVIHRHGRLQPSGPAVLAREGAGERVEAVGEARDHVEVVAVRVVVGARGDAGQRPGAGERSVWRRNSGRSAAPDPGGERGCREGDRGGGAFGAGLGRVDAERVVHLRRPQRAEVVDAADRQDMGEARAEGGVERGALAGHAGDEVAAGGVAGEADRAGDERGGMGDGRRDLRVIAARRASGASV